MSRIFIFSDLHADHQENLALLQDLCGVSYRDDTIVVAGDISDSQMLLQNVFALLAIKFKSVCFVPGNHELWLRQESCQNSIEKFETVMAICQEIGITTSPLKVQGKYSCIWLVPIFSWYRLPEQGEKTLYIEKSTENTERRIWGDFKFCKWPSSMDSIYPADYFQKLNETNIVKKYDAPVISYSHFLPRRDLIFGDIQYAEKYADGTTPIEPHPLDPHPYFNFSRVAGDQRIEDQIRQLNSKIHIYGHQHRNRDREIDGIRYISHCLGSPHERRLLASSDLLPKCIWEG